jgi:hypothetical protein
MKAVISLEIIGDDYYAWQRAGKPGDSLRYKRYEERFGPDKARPWVARITGLDDQYGFSREFLTADNRDYRDANSIGSRGVMEYFVLDDGIYEVHERVAWKRTRRYFVHVDGERITEVAREEVEIWLENAT